jgi:hypothetical protein
MSATRDTDQIISAWLDQMPDRVSDRVVGNVLQAVATVPQVRRPRFGRLRRPINMNRLVLIGATAALAVALVGGAIYFGGTSVPTATQSPASTLNATINPPTNVPRTPAVTSLASSSTVASPTPFALGGPLPAQLQARWMGSDRDFTSEGAGSSLLLNSTSFEMAQSNGNGTPHALGSAGSTAEGELNVDDSSVHRCTNDGVGQYGYSLSPSGHVLTVALVNDSCTTRAAELPGTYWLDGCVDPGTDCLGDLDPGAYSSQYIRPIPVDPWHPLFGGVEYTVPTGWANYADWPGWLGVTTSAAFANTTPDNTSPVESIDVLSDAKPLSAPCSDTPSDVQVNAIDLLGALTRNATPTKPTAITIDGNSGYYVDVSPGAKVRSCGPGGSYFFAGGSGEGLDPGERNRLIALDLPDGHVLAILLRSQASTFDSFVAAATPIVQSMAFK